MEKTDDRTVGRDSDKFMLRFPDGMRGLIASSAKINGRSMNAEIIARLAASFNPQPSGDSFDMEQYEQLKADVLKEVLAALEKREEKQIGGG